MKFSDIWRIVCRKAKREQEDQFKEFYQVESKDDHNLNGNGRNRNGGK
jgi:hypothetical protein